jgi:hypothetical protein
MCRVAFTDTEGMTHSIKVTAGSVLEAAALGLAEHRKCQMVDAAPPLAVRGGRPVVITTQVKFAQAPPATVFAIHRQGDRPME